MKPRNKFERQVAASNERLTAISPKAIEWGARNLSSIRHLECRAERPLAETAVISSDTREKVCMWFALIAVIDLKSRTLSNEPIKREAILQCLTPLTACKWSVFSYCQPTSRKVSRWIYAIPRYAVFGSMPRGSPHWHLRQELSAIIVIASTGAQK